MVCNWMTNSTYNSIQKEELMRLLPPAKSEPETPPWSDTIYWYITDLQKVNENVNILSLS